MNAKLISLAGPLKGMIFDLTGESLSIGRDVSNRIALNDKSISRRHCQVDRENQIYRLTDLESYNGTFINEAQVREQALNHGDRIRVGSSLFLFLLDDEPTLRRHGEVVADRGPDPADRLPGVQRLGCGAVAEGMQHVPVREVAAVGVAELLTHQLPELTEPHRATLPG